MLFQMLLGKLLYPCGIRKKHGHRTHFRFAPNARRPACANRSLAIDDQGAHGPPDSGGSRTQQAARDDEGNRWRVGAALVGFSRGFCGDDQGPSLSW